MIRMQSQNLVDAKFIGIPYLREGKTFDGTDETGLLQLWFSSQKINFPNVSDGWWGNAKTLQEVMKLCEIVPLKIIKRNDILLLTEPGTRESAHVGVIINSGWFLHMEEQSKVSQFNKRWMNMYGASLRIGGI